ncbi:MAG: tetratricopeptide repeat protein [Opitutaceae bacterium]|nr:tetratricopeptide repeat protein [Cytophagales bacterium]
MNKFLKKAGFTCLFLFVYFYGISFSPPCYFSSEQKKAYNLILKLNFKVPVKFLNGQDINNFQLKSLSYCLDAFVNCDKRKYQLGRRLSLKWIDTVSNSKEGEEKRFVKALIKIHWAFIASTYNEKVFAALEMRQAYMLLKENFQMYPHHKPTLLYYGLFNSFIADIPETYKWIANAVGLRSSFQTGIYMVNSSRNCDPLLELEKNALMLLRKPQTELEVRAINKACDYLMEMHGNDDLIKFLVAFYYLKNKNTHEASIILRNIHDNSSPMLVYQKALSSYNNLEIDTAIYYFKKFNKINKSESFKKDASLKLSYLNFLEGDTIQGKRYLSSIKKIGNDAIYADKAAEKLSNQQIPDFLTLKSRILFDAGNWSDAKRFLLLIKPQTIPQKTEYYYRLGKSEFELGNLEKAIFYYKECAKVCPKQNSYYGPFACLNLAEICLNLNDKIKAKSFLNSSKNFSGFDFQSTYRIRFAELSKLIR